jgi:DNA-binding transcriptional MerR regulator
MKRGGGRRYYRPDDIYLLRGIRHLLYGEGYTIRGVQRILREQGIKFVQSVWQEGAPQPPHGANADDLIDDGNDAAEDATDRAADDVIADERGGGLLGRIPSLLGRDLRERDGPGDRREPPMASAPVPRVDPSERTGQALAAQRAPARGPGLSRDDIGRLRAALHELGECRKLIDNARLIDSELTTP